MIKREFIFSILIITALASCKNPLTPKCENKPISDTLFSFSIRKFYNESSKDSHHYYQMFSLKKGVLFYDYVYKGFPNDEEEHKKKILNDSIILLIKIKLNELELYQDYSKEYPVNNSGFRSESGYSLIINTDTSDYSLMVKGKIPYDVDNEVYNNLSAFYYFIHSVFPQKP